MVCGRRAGTERIYDWKLEGSNDDMNWTLIDSYTNKYMNAEAQYIDLPSPSMTFSWIRIFVNNAEPTNPGLSAWQLYAINLSMF